MAEREVGLLERFPALRKLVGEGSTIPFVQQLSAAECGVACLVMVLGYHGKIVNREEVRELIGAGRDGTTARTLLEAAARFGLRGRGVRIEVEEVELLDPSAILHWGFNHFVVFERLTKDGVEILDPALGRRRIPMDEFGRSFTGVALLLEPSETFQRSAGERASKRGYFSRVLASSGEWSRIFTTSFFLQILMLALPLVTGVIVDRVVPRGDLHLLWVLAGGLSAIILFHSLASLIRTHLLLNLRTLIDARLTLDFVEHLVGLPYAFFQKRSSGDLIMRLNSNALVREVLTSGALSGVLDGALMSIYVVLLFVVSPPMGGLVLALGALQSSVFLLTRARQREINALSIEKQSRVRSYEVEMLAGIETLKAMGSETRAQEQWNDLFVDVLNVSLTAGRLNAAFDALSSALRMIAPLSILGVGAYKVVHGDFSLGTMLALNTFAVGVFSPLSSLVSTAVQFQLLGNYIERITDVRDAPLEQDRSRVRPVDALLGRIDLEQVSFRYGPLDPVVVNEVSLTVEPGQFVAIVGRSGSGKSTLASLLLGLYPPTSGRILYDGENLAELDLRSVRRRLGIVTQRTYLFGTTIRANIALANPETPLETIVAAARVAQIHDEIARMPMGYDTLLLDGGGSLSGGQRQRVALARALVQSPAILLLDEATSALDAITERRVQNALAALRCTRIVIAHRLSTVAAADRILVMEGGRLVEQGTHAELLARGGIYAELVETQLSGGA